ncbi:PAS domain-containing protein [Campylobacter sp. JMF_04 NA10]|uniref:PAS domain-containing protein n=1 Tax=Campylobacter sp. JMF_04 NA10 TaxID=2983824 RepID=UPI0022E9DFC3|nr:PAS domain-containing protein [Campylobacter sp. JMF_04 NA10]MDA3076038.1 PAS domain-containing protein [Campylobacter sp. JMF_04 NA10]
MKKPTPKNEEIRLEPDRYIVSKTDTKGFITFANTYFCYICGYSADELLGSPHSIIRHPDMPRLAFKMMWDEINQGHDFIALVKNLAKDGRYYWVMTEFRPYRDPLSGEIYEHTAYRKAPPRSAIETIAPIYAKLLEAEKTGGIKASKKILDEILASKGKTYKEWILELTLRKDTFTDNFFRTMRNIFNRGEI